MATQNIKFAGEAAVNALATEINKKLTKVSSMPESPDLNMIVLYVGATTSPYIQGNIYQWNGTQWNLLSRSSGGASIDDTTTALDTVWSSQKVSNELDNISPEWGNITGTLSDQTDLQTALSEKASTVELTQIQYDALPSVDKNDPSKIYFIYKENIQEGWTGLTDFNGNRIWTDGTNIYYSYSVNQYRLDGTTWEPFTWTGLMNIIGSEIWTDGTNTYYSYYIDQYKLNGTTWEAITWTGLTDFYGSEIWTDGTNTYYSSGTDQYKLNGTTWEPFTWTGLTDFNGNRIWTDGTNIYYSYIANQYKLNGTTWESMTWTGLTSFNGANIWTDGTNTYYSSGTDQYRLNGTTWELPTFIEMEGDTIYYKDKKYSGSGSSSFPTELNNYTNPTFTKGTVITVPTTQDSDIIKADSFAVPVCDKDLACSEYNTYDGYGTITLAEDYSGTDLQIGFLVIPSIS